MPKKTIIIETENGFSFDRVLTDHNPKSYQAKISLPYPEVIKRDLVGKKLKITVEVIDNE